jgi:hypothetical protein
MSYRMSKEDLKQYQYELSAMGYYNLRNDACCVYYNTNLIQARAWSGRKTKPEWIYRFKTVDAMMTYINKFMKDKITLYNEQQADKEYNIHDLIKLNDVFYSSWGYNQTNVDFFQTVKILNRSVIIREIKQERTETDYMCGYTVPRVNDFKNDKIMTKRLSVYKKRVSIKIDHNYAWPLDVQAEVNGIKIYMSRFYSSYA